MQTTKEIREANGNSVANKIESEILTKMVGALELLNHIHTWHKNVDRDKLWENRARLQDAIRAMNDEKSLRKL